MTGIYLTSKQEQRFNISLKFTELIINLSTLLSNNYLAVLKNSALFFLYHLNKDLTNKIDYLIRTVSYK